MLPRRERNALAPNRVAHPVESPAAVPTLRLMCNGSVKQELSLDSPQLLIGRSEDNDVSIPSRYASRYHILLVRHGDSTILVDLESTNGTFVNSERVYNRVLVDGDVIAIDQQSLFVEHTIEYCNPAATAENALEGGESAAGAIKQALAEVRKLLGKSDTDLLPTLREDVPTAIGIIDDR
jgi:pSer/pThr/pTyr-binding forkhead associated (FHA) protein